MIDVLLPWPPSSNNLFANARKGRGRYPTKRYAEWHDEAARALTLQRARPISGPVTVTILLNSPTKRPYDLDNRVKPILDLLTSLSLIDDDRADIVTKITVERSSGFTGAWLLVEPIMTDELSGWKDTRVGEAA